MAFEVNVKVGDLIEKVKANRDKHREVFDDALEGYREAAEKALADRIEKVRARGRGVNLYVQLDEPKDHTRDYDRVLEMLAMHLAAGNDTITLSEGDAAKYVRDDWAWKQQWARTASSYANSSYTARYGEYVEE